MPDRKGIYLSNNDFVPFDTDSLTTEIATRQNAGVSLFELGHWLSELPDPDPVLRKRGDDAQILTELSADDQVTTATLSRKNRVLNVLSYAFRPGGPDGVAPTKEAILAHERLIQDLERMNMRDIISGILDAPLYGMSPLELLWAGDGQGWHHLSDVSARPYHWFAYDQRNVPFFRGAQGWMASDPVMLPEGKFVIVRYHATYDNPYGLRLLSRCLWPVAFKRGGLQFYAKFVERHGMPWVVAKAPTRSTRQEKRATAADLARMVQDGVAVLPFGSEVEFLSAAIGQDMLHERFLARQDKAISKVIMGQTLTVEMEGRNNSQAAATTHADVAQGLADADKAMVTDAFNEIAWLYTRANMGPEVFAPVFAYEEPGNLLSRADLDTKLCDMGVTFTKEHFTSTYNLQEKEFELRSQSDAPDSFSASAETRSESPATLAVEAQSRLDEAVAKLLPDALKAGGEIVTQLENAVRSANSFDEAELALVQVLASRMTQSDLESFLAQAMTAAAGFGAASVREEAEEDRS